MESIKIKRISEGDFDNVLASAGGRRLPEEGSADYELNEAFIELKLLEEEGLEKETRRLKLAKLFRARQPGRPVIIIDPDKLDAAGQREYYSIVEGPIKTHVKKAARQLEKTANERRPNATRVLVIANIGYTALSPEEFKTVCVKCVHHDTSKIDSIICAGIYYQSNGFEMRILTRFEHIAVNLDRSFRSQGKLLDQWNLFLNEAMAEHIRQGPLEIGNLPLIDLEFELDGIRFIKPAPQMPPSDFWPGGRPPRSNSRESEPPVPLAKSFPAMDRENWKRFKEVFPQIATLQQSYDDWLRLQGEEEERLHEDRHPFIPISVSFEEFSRTIEKHRPAWEFRDVCKFATDLLNARIRTVLENVTDGASRAIVPVEYLHITVEEIGSDKANDLCTIHHVSEVPGFEKSEVIIENLRAFWEESVCIAACYAVKRGVSFIVYRKC
jgi:hypothetical protein